MSADEVAEKILEKLSKGRRRPFAESRPEDRSGDDLWNAYLDAVEGEDKANVESWNGSTTGILTFTGLFAATVAAFVIESYKMLQPDSGSQSVALLAQLVAVNNATAVVPPSERSSEPFQPADAAVLFNSLWFLSLVISLVCALLATLIQEWTRDFLRDISRRTPGMTIKEYAYNHVYVRMSVEKFKLDYVASLIVALMHVAVILFLVGLAIFLRQTHHVPALVVEIAGIVAAAIYTVLSLIPAMDNSCPYRTPLTYAFIAAEAASICVLMPVLTFFVTVATAIVQTKRWTKMSRVIFSRLFITFATDYLIATTRFGLYYFLPTSRCLPGHQRVPVDVADNFFSISSDKLPEQRRFVDDARMSFIWEHVGEYLLGNNDPAFVRYLPLQVLDLDTHDYGSFFVYLRHSTFGHRIATRLTSLETVEDGIGTLRLLRSLIGAENGLEARLDPIGDDRFLGLGDILKRFPEIVQKINSMNEGATAEEEVDMLAALTDFRWTLILVRTKFLLRRGARTRMPSYDGDLECLDKMLLALENIEGFRLLSLYSKAHGLNSVEFEWHRGDVMWGLELAARNVFTLLIHLVLRKHVSEYWRKLVLVSEHLQGPVFSDLWTKAIVLPGYWNWQEAFVKAGIPLNSEGAHQRQGSRMFVHLLDHVAAEQGLETISNAPLSLRRDMDGQKFVAHMLNRLMNLAVVTLPNPPQLFRMRLQHEQEWKDLGAMVSHTSKPPSSDLSPNAQDELVSHATQPNTRVDLDAHTELPDDSLKITSVFNQSTTHPPAYVMPPLSHLMISSQPFALASELPISLLRYEATPGGETGTDTSAFIVEEQPPDSPSLRSAEEGGVGLKEANA